MKQVLTLFGIFAWVQGAAGQTCAHADLSKEFVFGTSLAGAKPANSPQPNSPDSAYFGRSAVTISITSKLSETPRQLIHFSTGLLFNTAYRNCDAVRSHTTKKNRHADATDNDYGDLIVADFNFDGREDFAAKNDSGGNAGPLYNFYVQSASGEFILDEFLTAEMQFFPVSINKSRRTLTTRLHAGANGLGETVFQLEPQTGKWREISHRILPVNTR